MTTEKSCLGCFCDSENHLEHLVDGLSALRHTPEEQSYIDHRYLPLLREASNDARLRSCQFHLCVNAITIGAILVTTFTALGGNNRTTQANEAGLYWTVIVLGAVMAIANKWMYLFGIHKKYILTQRAKERYGAEGWHYIGAVGKYCRPPGERFGVFCERIERIQAKSVKDMVSLNATSANAASADGITPRSDDNATIISMGTPTPRVASKRAVFGIPAVKIDKDSPDKAQKDKIQRLSGTGSPPAKQDPTIVLPPDNIAPPTHKKSDRLQPPTYTT